MVKRKGFGKKHRYYPGVYLEEMRKTIGNFS
jgi:hypothetical protein